MLVQDLIDRLKQLQSDRSPWEQHWLETAVYALPDAERFDALFITGQTATAVDSVVSTPVAARRSKDIYDLTSLWAIDRGANGTISMVMPQTGTWHDITTSDPFGGEPSDAEDLFYENYRDYLFRTRANPRSGFWTANKAAVRCMWAFGTGVYYVEESDRDISSPISYAYSPISENHLGTNFENVVDTNFRLFRRSARQCVEKWGSKMSAKVQADAVDPKKKDRPVPILHAVYPRDEKGSYGNTNREAPFASCYVEVDEKNLIGEAGYWEFPFIVYHWQRNNTGPYAEGPMALALAEVKSLNMLSKSELRAVQQWMSPPYATRGDMARLNLNANAPNPGFLSETGELLAKPLIMQQRPDLARAILDGRREAVGKTLYLPFWTAIMDSTREKTAFEQMKIDAERGDILGPVGSSMQTGLSSLVDRETGILARKGAFDTGSPLAPPDSIRGKSIGARFTSPLDRLRRLPQLQGMTQLAQITAQIAQFKPDVVGKINWDAYIDEAQEILDVPQKVMTPDDVLQQNRAAESMRANVQTGIQTTHDAGVAAGEAGKGVAQIADSPAAAEVLKRLAGVSGIPA